VSFVINSVGPEANRMCAILWPSLIHLRKGDDV